MFWTLHAGGYLGPGSEGEGGVDVRTPTSLISLPDGSLTPAAIVAGGRTIVINVTGDTWVASGATFNAQRQAIIDGLTSNRSETHGWNAEVRDALGVSAVVRTSDSDVTITLPAFASFAVTASERVTLTIPADALEGAVELIAANTFGIGGFSRGSALLFWLFN